MKKYNAGAPLERIALVIMGPLPKTDKGNKYIMVVGDYFTKWTQAIPLKQIDATTVARKLVNQFICIVGVRY